MRLSGWGGEGEGRGKGAIITSDPVSHLMHALGSWLKRWRAPFGIVGALMSSDTCEESREVRRVGMKGGGRGGGEGRGESFGWMGAAWEEDEG